MQPIPKPSIQYPAFQICDIASYALLFLYFVLIIALFYIIGKMHAILYQNVNMLYFLSVENIFLSTKQNPLIPITWDKPVETVDNFSASLWVSSSVWPILHRISSPAYNVERR